MNARPPATGAQPSATTPEAGPVSSGGPAAPGVIEEVKTVTLVPPPAAPSNPASSKPVSVQTPRTPMAPVSSPLTPLTAASPAAPVSRRFATPPMGNRTIPFPQLGSTLSSSRGSYVVRAVIGAGEFGAVYDCIGPFDQAYAVKMMRPAHRPYAEVQAEWAREVQRLMSLRHPNVVYIHDAFENNSLFYLALERCDHALTAMLGRPMQEGLTIELARQLLAAVQFLHDNDIVHDDIHPGNVLITHADRPIVKLADFGISHELRGRPAIRPNVVHHAIMAPEILSTGYTSKQSDIYQVGLLLYWMLTGHPAMVLDAPYPELVRQVSEGDARRRAEAIGTPLGGLIAKMLRRREAYRYLAAKEVWADLRELPAWKQRQLFPAK